MSCVLLHFLQLPASLYKPCLCGETKGLDTGLPGSPGTLPWKEGVPGGPVALLASPRFLRCIRCQTPSLRFCLSQFMCKAGDERALCLPPGQVPGGWKLSLTHRCFRLVSPLPGSCCVRDARPGASYQRASYGRLPLATSNVTGPSGPAVRAGAKQPEHLCAKRPSFHLHDHTLVAGVADSVSFSD